MEIESSVSVPWPHPCDIIVKKFDNLDDLYEFVKTRVEYQPESVMERRILLLDIAEHLLANPRFSCLLIHLNKTIANKLDEYAESITTFDAKSYASKIRNLS